MGKVAQKTIKRNKAYEASAKPSDFTLSASQKTMQNVLRENTLSFIEGPAGTGKTFGILHYFCSEYLRDSTKRIIVVRTPAESAGKDKIGYLPSDLEAKIEPHFASARKILESLLTAGKVDTDCKKGGRIEFLIPNFMLGCTLDNAMILIDEAQMMEPLVLKLCLERIGENSICVVSGDASQVYSNDSNRNGLHHAIGKFFYAPNIRKAEEFLPKYPEVGHFKFDIEDCMRSSIVKTVLAAYS